MSNEKLTPWPHGPHAGWEQCDYNEWHETRFRAAMERLNLAVTTLDALVMTLPPGSNRFLVADTIAAIDMPKEAE